MQAVKVGGVISSSQQELKGYGDIILNQTSKFTSAVNITDKALKAAFNDFKTLVEKYTNPSTEFEEKQFWKDYYRVSNENNNTFQKTKETNQGRIFIEQGLDMMKVLAGKYHGVKIYDKSLANFKLKPLSEIKKK